MAAAKKAQKELFNSRLEVREKIIKSIREHLSQFIQELAEIGVKETGMGRVIDKALKHQVTLEKLQE